MIPSQAKESKTTRSQLFRSVTQNPGDFPLKQRFLLPASVSGAQGEAWVPSAPRWPLHTTVCPAKRHGRHRLEKLISMGKGRKRACGTWGTTALAAGRGFCSQVNTGLMSGTTDFPSHFFHGWIDQHLTLGKAET